MGNPELQIRHVFLGQCSPVQPSAGQTDSLMVSENPARHDPTPHVRAIRRQYFEMNQTVISEDPIPGPNFSEEFGERGMSALSGPHDGPAGNGKLRSRPEQSRPPFEIPQANLWSGKVLKDGYRLSQLHLEGSDPLDDPSMFLMGAMGEVETGNIHPGEDEALKNLFGLAGGTDRTHDLCPPYLLAYPCGHYPPTFFVAIFT